MAYADHKAATNQKAIAAGVVALLQGAAIVALINGLAVHLIPVAPDPPLAGEQIYLPPPPPPPIEPQAKKPEPVKDTPITAPPVRDPLPPQGANRIEGPVAPVDPGPVATGSPGPVTDPTPPVVPRVPPQAARARNDPGSWIGPADYPYRDQLEGHQGAVRIQLDIGVDGRVQGCRVLAGSGYPGLDAATCATVSRRARFEPARDGDGQKTIGSYTGTIRWVIPD